MFQINVAEKIKTPILCSITFPEHRAVYDNMLKKLVEPDRPQKIWRLRVAYRISKPTCAQAHDCARAPTPIHTHTRARVRNQERTHTSTHTHIHTHTHTHTQTHTHTHTHKYIILIAFTRQQWFHERASVLRNTYIVYLFIWYECSTIYFRISDFIGPFFTESLPM